MNEDVEVFLRGAIDIKHLFGDKWTAAIFAALSNGPMRRTEILSTVNSYAVHDGWSSRPDVLHDSILARALKKPTGEGLLVHDYNGSVFPPAAHYALTPEAEEFLALVRGVALWASRHADLVVRAQAYNRGHGAGGGSRNRELAMPG